MERDQRYGRPLRWMEGKRISCPLELMFLSFIQCIMVLHVFSARSYSLNVFNAKVIYLLCAFHDNLKRQINVLIVVISWSNCTKYAFLFHLYVLCKLAHCRHAIMTTLSCLLRINGANHTSAQAPHSLWVIMYKNCTIAAVSCIPSSLTPLTVV